MIFGALDDKELNALAIKLAKELGLRFPPRSLLDKNGKANDSNVAKAVQHLSARAKSYRKEHKVGMLKRLGLSRAFQRELNALGYEEDFIKQAMLALLGGLSEKA